jgi:hypothetical protein
MKKIVLAAAALVFMVASPAFAQSYDPDIGSGNLDSAPYANNSYNAYGSWAQVSPYGAYGYDPYYGGYAPAPRVGHRHHHTVR